MKKVLVFIIFIILMIIGFLYIYPVIKNNSYEKGLFKNVYDNTDIENISYLNKSNNYYILKTDSEVIVLDLNYEEVFRDVITSLYVSELDLVYRRNKLFYVEKKVNGKKISYNYYDVYTYELIYETNIGGE